MDLYGDPALPLYRMFRCTKEPCDQRMQLDLLEEQFHLPGRLVERTDGDGWHGEAAG